MQLLTFLTELFIANETGKEPFYLSSFSWPSFPSQNCITFVFHLDMFLIQVIALKTHIFTLPQLAIKAKVHRI